MGNYTGFATLVGMDVHARSIDARALIVSTGEYRRKVFSNCPTPGEVAEWLSSLPQPVAAAYESGCTGFHLARELTALGIRCDVVAVSTLPRSVKDSQQKCDKLDARVILREMANPASMMSAVWIPDEHTEAQRELVRAHSRAVDNTKRAKQRLLSFLLLHGYVWNEKTKKGNLKKAWTRAFHSWLDSISFKESALETTFAAYRRQIRTAEQEEAELHRQIIAISGLPENKPFVDAISLFKGVSDEIALLSRVEFGEFMRFTRGRAVSCWAGVVPSDNSSGAHEGHGSITKAGCSHLRKALVEGLSGIDSWNPMPKATSEKTGDVSSAALDIACRANIRIYERYDHLRNDLGKCHNKAKIAVINELVRWIWVMGCQVQREQERAGA